MPKSARRKTALLWLVFAASLLLVLPSLLPAATVARLPSWFSAHRLAPGLDLTGGSRILLEADPASLEADRLHAAVDAVGNALRTSRIAFSGLSGLDRVVEFSVPDAARRDEARSAVAALGLGTVSDDGNGVLRLDMPEAASGPALSEAALSAADVVRRRIETLGIFSATITHHKGGRISIAMPGLLDAQHVKDLLGQRGRLAARLVDERVPLEEAIEQGPPAGSEILYSAGEPPVGYVVRRETLFTVADIVSAEAAADGAARVDMRLTADAAERLRRLTSENIGRTIAIVLDGQVISAPVIRDAATGDTSSVTGDFDAAGAGNLARVIASGALPAEFTIIEERSVEPALGAASGRSALIALVVAAIAVVAFVTAFYGVLGVIASIGLFFNMLLMLAVLALIGVPVTLSVVAGIVLTIGIAVDASVLAYERVREEKKAGRSLADAVDTGFSRAFSTVLDAAATTLIAITVLFFLAADPVREFALTVGIGILATIFATFTLTRSLVIAWLRRTRASHLPAGIRTAVFDGLNIRFMAARNGVFLAAAVLSIAVAGLLLSGGLKLGIDFTGGSSLEIRAKAGNADLADIAARLADVNIEVLDVARHGGPNTALVRIAPVGGGDNAEQTQVLVARGELEADYEFRRVEVVGPSVASDLIAAATLGLLAGLAALVAYIWVRFEWHFAIGAMIALAHDVFLTIGLFALTGLEFNIGAVAALLTVAGYSLNDTVVVYDRIRENLRQFRHMPLPILIDDAINRTLSRTVLTSATTLIALAALSLFGGEVIRAFALTLLFGVAVGTVSSIYIAGPILILFRLRPESYRPGRGAKGTAPQAKGTDGQGH